jgi:hypothetical protein
MLKICRNNENLNKKHFCRTKKGRKVKGEWKLFIFPTCVFESGACLSPCGHNALSCVGQKFFDCAASAGWPVGHDLGTGQTTTERASVEAESATPRRQPIAQVARILFKNNLPESGAPTATLQRVH